MIDKDILIAQAERMAELCYQREKLKSVTYGFYDIDDNGAFVSGEYFEELVSILDVWHFESFKQEYGLGYKLTGYRNGARYYAYARVNLVQRLLTDHMDNFSKEKPPESDQSINSTNFTAKPKPCQLAPSFAEILDNVFGGRK